MFEVTLRLKMGSLKSGRFSEWDTVDFEIETFQDDVACDNVNNWLNVQADPICDYAELRVRCTGVPHEGFLIASFKKIKLKSKNNPYRWIVVD